MIERNFVSGDGKPLLCVIVPCYNEQEVLPVTAPMFEKQLRDMMGEGLISEKSRVVFVDDGSRDGTWEIISRLAENSEIFCGLRQSRNRGHQNAVLAGLMESRETCDITISIDCDGQDDIGAMTEMVKAYLGGSEVVYGVRTDRSTDSFFKRTTARGFYKFMGAMGVETVYDHADYRLISATVLSHLADFREVNLFLRGMIPLVGFTSSQVGYERHERLAGKSHYPLSKMIRLAVDGITSLSTRPLGIITGIGVFFAFVSFVGVVWSVVTALLGKAVAGWASTVSIICFLGSIQLICLGIIGTYVGKIYLEVKHRPRYIISERTDSRK